MQAGFNSFASYRRVAVNDTPVTDERQKKDDDDDDDDFLSGKKSELFISKRKLGSSLKDI